MAHGTSAGFLRRQERHFGLVEKRAEEVVASKIRDFVEARDVNSLPNALVERAPQNRGGSSSSSGTSSSGRGSSSSQGGNGGNGGASESSSSSENDASSSDSLNSSSSSRSSSSSTSSSSTPSSSSTSSTSSSSSTSSYTPRTTAERETSTSSSSSSSPSTTAAAETSSSSTSTMSLSRLTSVAYVTSSASAIPTNNAAASKQSSDSNSLGAGPIVGIVAGALAGAAVLAILVGFVVKRLRTRKEDPYEANPFDRDEFRRQSLMFGEDDDGMGGFGQHEYQPPMSEVHSNGFVSPEHYQDYEHYANMTAGAGAGAAGAAGGYAMYQQDNGRPRPPTMFQRHLEHQASFNTAYEVPPSPVRVRSDSEQIPQLPEAAYGGSDPYSLAGVGRLAAHDNINNPYEYLDRRSPMPRKSTNQSTFSDIGAKQSELYDTNGRPGTSEGRSGTPDLPNLQQTYAMGRGVAASGSNGSNGSGFTDELGNANNPPQRFVSSPQQYDYDQQAMAQHNQGALHVRNQHSFGQQQRPLSTAAEGDEDAAYDGYQ